jgi:serine/threonine-protein kinase
MVLIDVLEALDFAHSRKVLHRDVKPANVFIDAHGRAKLGDFGLAHQAGLTRLTSTGAAVGTPENMAPEQAEGLASDERTDLYAAGVLLYEALSGHPPFQAPKPLAVLRMHVEKEPPLLPEDVPAGLGEIVARALAKRPEDRWQTATLMRVRLLEVLENLPSSPTVETGALATAETRELAPEPRVPPKARVGHEAGSRKPRRRKRIVLVLLLLLGSSGIVIALKNRGHAKPRDWVSVELRDGRTFEAELVDLDTDRGYLVTKLGTGEVRSDSLETIAAYNRTLR